MPYGISDDDGSLESLNTAYVRDDTLSRCRPEESPFTVLFADITHRCNMPCKNCYIPTRNLPDLPVEWLYDVLRRLPRRAQVRLVGAEPTMREDLPDIISEVRKIGHVPQLLTNGLKLRRRAYTERLKASGLRSVYISMNGGTSDRLYKVIDNLPCADRKLRALDNLLALHMNIIVGMILVRGVNEAHLADFLPYVLVRRVNRLHLRSVGPIGRYMDGAPLTLEELETCVERSLKAVQQRLECTDRSSRTRDYRTGQLKIHTVQWPELGSMRRGRIAPDGFIEPMFESVIANAGSY